MKYKIGDKLIGRTPKRGGADFDIEIEDIDGDSYIASYRYITGDHRGYSRSGWPVRPEQLDKFLENYQIAHSPLGKALE